MGENADNLKNKTTNKQTTHTHGNYANTHPMTTRAAAKLCHPVAQVTVSQIESTRKDNSGNIATFDAYDKLNNIIK